MRRRFYVRWSIHSLGLCAGTLACGEGHAPPASTPSQEPPGWSEQSHAKSASPDYERLFPADRVLELELTIAPEDWQAMLDDMTDMAGEFGQAGPGGGGLVLPEAARAACSGRQEQDACSYDEGDQSIEGECRAGPNAQELHCIPRGLNDGMLPPPGVGMEQPLGDDAEFLPRTPLWRACRVRLRRTHMAGGRGTVQGKLYAIERLATRFVQAAVAPSLRQVRRPGGYRRSAVLWLSDTFFREQRDRSFVRARGARR
jgi:hypothetical protein